MLSCFSEDPLLSSFLIKIECALVLLSPPRNASRIQVQPAGNHENVKWKNPKGVLSWSQTNPRMEGGSQQLHAHRITRITPSLMELQVQQSSLGPQGAETLEQGQRTQARRSPEAALTCASLEREGGAGAQWDRPRIQWLFNWYEKTPSRQRHTWHAPSQAPTFKTPALTRQLRRTNWALQEGDRIGTLRKGDRIGTTPVASQAWKDSTGKALAASLD